MAINATNTGNAIELIPPGSYVARCYSMIHIGTINVEYQGQTKMLNKVRLTFELPTELRVFNEEKGEQPMVKSKEFTLSMHEKSTLRQFLESWRGKGFTDEESKLFDITKLLGIDCMLSIIHKESKNGGNYADISSISRIPKGMKCPPQVNENFEFNFEDKFNIQVLESFPDFIKDKIKSSQEYIKITGDLEEIELQKEDEDLPF